MTGRSAFLNVYDRVRVHVAVDRPAAALRRVRELFYRHLDAPHDRPVQVRVNFGKLPGSPPPPRCVQWDWSYKGLARYRARIVGLDGGPITAWVHANRYGAAFFVGRVLDTLIKEALLREDLVAVHAAGVMRKSRGVLLPGRQGTGKSLMALTFMRHGYRLLGDDRVLATPDGRMLGMLFPMTVRYGCGVEKLVKLTPRQHMSLTLKGMVGRLTCGYYQLMTVLHTEDIFPDGLAERAELTDVVHLEHGDDFADLGPVSHEDMLGLVMANERTSNPDTAALIDRVAAIEPDCPFAHYFDRTGEILLRAFAAAACRRVAVPRRFVLEAFERLPKLLDA